MIISFLNQKGGVGKTTLSINAAAALSRGGARVLLVDADEQQSAVKWASVRDETPFHVVSMARPNMARELMDMATDYSHVIIDAPPRGDKIPRAVIIASDIVVIPIEPSGLSVWAAQETVDQIAEAQALKENLKCGFVVSRKIGKTVIGREIRDIAADMQTPVLSSEIEQRVAFAESVMMGQTIFEYAPRSEAAQEIENLVTELEVLYGRKNIQGRKKARSKKAVRQAG